MFDCLPIRRLIKYKWNLIKDQNFDNFVLFTIMLTCLLINTCLLSIYNSNIYIIVLNIISNLIVFAILWVLIYREGFIKGANWIIAFTYICAVLY
jgi:hypothetical protein